MSFTGSSSFAIDLEQTIERAVAIASLPLQQLRNDRTSLEQQNTALGKIDEQFAGLQTAIDALGTALTSGLHSAAVGDESVAQVTLGDNVLAADYSVDVSSLGARTLTLNLDSLPTVTDPLTESISSSGDYTLTVDGVDYAVSPEGDSLFDLATALNASDADVQASVVNIGGSAGADYRLSIQSEKYADVGIQLNDGSQDLLQTLATGAPVTYQVNGVPSEGIEADSRTITLAPGVTVDLLGTGATDIVVSKETGNIADALNSFVTAYNTAVDELDLHRGTNGGVLNGEAILSTLARSLSDVSGFSASEGAIGSLAGIGIDVDQTGRLSFDQTALESQPIDDVLSFLGDASSAGFLKAADDILSSVGESPDGLIELQKDSFDRQIETQDRLIAANEERIALMRENLTARLAAADAVIAALEQQALGISSLFESLQGNQEK